MNGGSVFGKMGYPLGFRGAEVEKREEIEK